MALRKAMRLGFAVLGLAACGMPPPGNDGGTDVVTPPDGDGGGATARAAASPTNGGAVAVSPDGTVAVAVNRDANSVSVFSIDTSGTAPVVTRRAELNTGNQTEPWVAIVSNDSTTAWVVLKRSQRVVRISGLKTTPVLDTAMATTGSEPTGIAISPTGSKLYVTNFVDGTVTVLNTTGLSTAGTIDLNPTLASSGYVGTVPTSRAALAHPRAIAITNDGDGDDSDETAYVTEFFSQRIPTVMVDAQGSNTDVTQRGLVYRFALSDNTVGALIPIEPVNDTGFTATTDGTATVASGCFTNQLYAATINSGKLFVSSVCESPKGPTGARTPAGGSTPNPANFKTEIFSVIAQVDLATNTELAANKLVLQKRFADLYSTRNTPAAEQRQPLMPVDLAFVGSSQVAYIVGYGSSALFRVRYNADGSLMEVGASTQPVIRLNPGSNDGLDPYGVAITGTTALVVNEFSRNLSVVNLDLQSVAAAVDSTTPAPTDPVRRGRHFFVTGLGRWSLDGQGWNSCEACHPNGLTDNVTWHFPRGPRQTISLDAMHAKSDPNDQRLLKLVSDLRRGRGL